MLVPTVSLLRITVPESLWPQAEAAGAGWSGPQLQWVACGPPADPRQRQRWLRLWLERRAGAGASSADAELALQDASVRALLAVWDRLADAAVLNQADAGCAAAWRMVEPAPSRGGCADIWIGEWPAGAEGAFGWLDWPTEAPLSQAVDAMRVAAAELAHLVGAAAMPCLVAFRGGKDRMQAQAERFAATLGARGPCCTVTLYSPLFFKDGRLQVAAWLEAVRRACPRGTAPLVCVPQLGRDEFAEALASAGGRWAGPLRAGAECAVARITPQTGAARLQDTLQWLARRAAAGPA